MKLFVLVLQILTIFIIQGAEVNASPCGDGWTPYKDEKCVQLLQSFATRHQAQEFCNEEASSLVIIKSAAEQLFLNEYVFNSSVENSVWIGAERRPNSATEFDWIDGSPVDGFTNWAVGSPSNNVEQACVRMKSNNFRQLSDMEWQDISCSEASWFICQKLQAWSIEDLQREILSTRRDMQNLAEGFTNMLADLQNQLTSEGTIRQNEIGSLRNEMISTSNNLSFQLNDLQTNPVPIGFIYVQLSDQSEPEAIWPRVTWTEVTSQYAGLFFRAVGGGSASFGSTQEESSPRLEAVSRMAVFFAGTIYSISVPSDGATSAVIGSGAFVESGQAGLGFMFRHSVTEVRPRNSAIRIWRRIQRN